MSADVETPIAIPAFARPTSLYVPDVPRSVAILDTTSYSPFPTFPGSTRSRDPYGLNAYLLHPGDSLWSYVDPVPDSSPNSASNSDEESSTPSGSKQVRKQRSLSVIRRPSPLSQPPVSAVPIPTVEVEDLPQPIERKRSNSVGSMPRLSLEEEEKVVATFRAEISKPPKTPKSSKKSLRKVFTLGRKSGAKTSDAPPMPTFQPELLAPTLSRSPENFDPTTPMSSRSNSNYSTLSSASSTSSSEGVKTPNEGVPIEIAITGSKLANALQEAGEKKNKGKTWRGWLGGKKVTKTAESYGSNTPSDGSASSTPNSSSPDLLSGPLPQVILTPSPSIVTPPSRTSPVLPSAQIARQHTWATEQLRRVSIRKMTQLRNPSPHPLALSLVRQHSRLPDEVAFSIQSGQRVFPKSVNAYQGVDGDLTPAEGGLWLGIAIRTVMVKLDQGQQPDGILKQRKLSKRSIVPRPRGVSDFINRPPFEERNIVFYPNETFSPISMARPGYGVWDLDFSPYIWALSSMDEPSTAWPDIRTSIGESADGFAEVIKAIEVETVDVATVEVLDSPVQGPEAAMISLTANAASVEVSPKSTPSASPLSSPTKERPLSSFRKATRTSSRSSSSSEDESADESDDDEPLAHVVRKRSLNFQPQATPSSSALPQSSHTRSKSQPDRDNRRSSKHVEARWKGLQQQYAMEEVVRARERREQNRLGEMEKRAMAEQILAKETSRRLSLMELNNVSSASPSKHHRRASSGGNLLLSSNPELVRPPSVHVSQASPRDSHRRRVTDHAQRLSPSPARPDTMRSRSGPVEHRGRYRSFYEQKAVSTTVPSLHPNAHHFAHHPHGHTHPSMQMYAHPSYAQAQGSRTPMMFGVLPHPQPMYQSVGGVRKGSRMA
ncbi:hypothetical protein CI109_103424 [Kwoniella shandongensis]|uniref:Uncharacterized protein n=1 Tax=Kwoniella shandongensis TaxID=1734106 RepID=A0A5M6BZE8_9TREE|nr:uncharacterized protein CI109_004505 [Kwoniella shandongensis]KAA5527212.1 hypothetical protein CI109_004505 [Kwoniella shandongensis]